ncbi:MAG: hypothetical protein FWF98_01005 [Dehalococcoidia bacterium]|nr:hypothetical protein [Dehalococcoidia bacterium]
MFEDFEIEIHCPECDAELEVKLSQIKRQESVSCPGCRKNIDLRPDEAPSSAETQAVDDSFANIRQTIESFQEPQV